MDIHQLKTLIHVAELGSVSKAADRLHIAQPALSRQIRQMEKELGVYLFERHGRGMVITDVGKEVLEHASKIMEEMESIRTLTSVGNSSYRGSIALGCTPTVAEIVTVPLVRKIAKAHPNLGFRLSSAFSGYLVDRLQRGELDLAVSYDLEPLHSLRIMPVMMENLMLVGAGDAGLSMDRPVPFVELADQKLVLPSAQHGLRVILEACARQADVDLWVNIEVDSFGAMINLVRNGLGMTVLPLAPIYSFIQSGALTAAPLEEPVPMRKLVLVYPADRKISPAAKFVGESLIEIATELVEQNVWAGHML